MDTMGLTLRRIPWDRTPCKLLERVAGKINEEILARYSKVEEVATTVHKPSVPIHGILKDVSVTLHKKR